MHHELFAHSDGGMRFAAYDLRFGYERSVRSAVEQARRTRLQRGRDRDGSFLMGYLGARVPSPKGPAPVDRDDWNGLLGGIVSEPYHTKTGDVPFYAKWGDAGTGRSRGVDLIVERDGVLTSIECEHTHVSAARGTDTEQTPLRILRRGLSRHTDIRTSMFLASLYTRYGNDIRLLDASDTDGHRARKKMEVIRRCLRQDDMHKGVDLAADDRYAGMDHAGFESRPGITQPDPSFGRVTALLLFVGGLYGTREGLAGHAA